MKKENVNVAAGWNLDNSYARLPQSFYTRLNPTLVAAPRLVAFNGALAKSLGLRVEALQNAAGVAVFAGNRIPEGGQPLAQAYAGHQFGHFTMLGDGRALLLGEQLSPNGERVDIQLKGSGRTPYSRGGDGRAALGPMLREYIISEAMFGLGIPTTRSLAVALTGETVLRETQQPGAILTRVASSHIRVGTFQYIANWGIAAELRMLADYTIGRHFPAIPDVADRYLLLLREVIQRQAALLAQWQLVGFIHGVMNTDNMAISGETIDYGPCAFMDTYDPATVFSSIDLHGRYAYGNQPDIAGWNLARFAETLLPLLHQEQAQAIELAETALSEFTGQYQAHWHAGMQAKLGIFNEETQDESLVGELLKLMAEHRADYTNTFRALTLGQPETTPLFTSDAFARWHRQWQARLDRQQQSKAASRQLMRDSNPAVIPRNHRVEAALASAVQGDYRELEQLLAVLANPYAYSSEQLAYSLPPESTDVPYRTFCGT